MKNSIEYTRNWRVKIGTLIMALLFVISAAAVRPARADAHEYYTRHWHQQRHYHHGHWHHRGYVYGSSPDVYYAPPPVVYAPLPPRGGFSFIFPFSIH